MCQFLTATIVSKIRIVAAVTSTVIVTATITVMAISGVLQALLLLLLLVLGMGIFAATELHNYVRMTPDFSATAPYIGIGIGAFMVLLALLACCCAAKEQPILLIVVGYVTKNIHFEIMYIYVNIIWTVLFKFTK